VSTQQAGSLAVLATQGRNVLGVCPGQSCQITFVSIGEREEIFAPAYPIQVKGGFKSF
jgi:hypothetical protein